MPDEKISQKLYPPDELREKVTIRVLPEKMQIYPRFKELVTEKIGSDVCFVTTSLWEAFIQAMDQLPPVNDQLEIKFLRQTVQINIGCSFNYTPKKARRYPRDPGAPPGSTVFTTPSQPKIEMRKNLFLPLVLDEWKTLNEKQKEMLRDQLIQEGIFPAPAPPKPKRKKRSDAGKPRKKRKARSPLPSVSTPKPRKKKKKIWELLENSMTNVSKKLRGLFK